MRLLVKVYNSYLRENLINLVKNYLDDEITNKMIELIEVGKDDIEIYKELHEMFKLKNIKYHSEDLFKKRAKNIAKRIKKYIKYYPQGIYIDIGCEDCYLPLAVGEQFRFKQNEIYCVNIKDWVSTYDLNFTRERCNFSYYDGINLPFADNSASIITILMVFHHVENINGLLDSISKKLKYNGILIVKEHDCPNELFSKLIDIQHYIFDMILKEEQTLVNDYKSTYYSRKNLDNILKKYGLIKFREKYNENKRYNPTNGYYGFFVKKKIDN